MLDRAGPANERRDAAVASAEDALPLAAILHTHGDEPDVLFGRLCDNLRVEGLRLGGVVQAQRRDCSGGLLVTDLHTGAQFGIWQDLGRGAMSCRLDEAGLADAVPAILAAIASGVDLVIINRFAKAESHGGGLLSAITAALDAGIPVLTAVREPYLEAWHTFHRGLAADLPPSQGEVEAWCRGAIAARRSAGDGQTPRI